MISYNPLWQTMKDRGVTTYALIYKHKISNGTLYRIRKGKPITTNTIDDLCKALKCTPNDIIQFIDE